MATTTNYAWETPDDTDLVKDGASAIRTLGSSIDTTTKALNPSTTLGDIEYRSSTANTNTRLGIGTDGQVLTVASGVPTWDTASSGSMTLLASGTLSGASVDVSGLSQSYKALKVMVKNWRPNADGNNLEFRLNNDGNARYKSNAFGGIVGAKPFDETEGFILGYAGDTAATTNFGIMDIWDYADTTHWKLVQSYQAAAWYSDPTQTSFGSQQTIYNQTTAITSVTFTADGGTFTAGNYYIYGVN